jgi:hypothetical protein
MVDTIDVAQVIAEIARSDTEPGIRAAQLLAEVARSDTEPGIRAAQVVVEIAYRVPEDEVGATLHTPFAV